MKKDIFAETYAQVQELKKAYDAAADEAGKEKARAGYHALMEGIEGLGAAACRIWREYETAMENGNARLDISEVVWEKDVESLISCMRENGISEFTFSSGWSGAVDTAWLFTQNGCRLEGLVEINSPHKAFGSDEYEKAHGYLFSIG